MEVHVPEHGIHSWRDFFVHMGTICLGLLIAIGLEQSVEWEHRRSERHEIQEAVREDLTNIVRDTQSTATTIRALVTWSETTMHTCRAALQENKSCELALCPRGGSMSPFTDPSFRAARASGLLVLLPQPEIRDLSDLDDRVDIEERFFEVQQSSSRRIQAFERQLGRTGSESLDRQQAGPDEQKRFLETLDVWDGDLRNMAFINTEAHDEAVSLLDHWSQLQAR